MSTLCYSEAVHTVRAAGHDCTAGPDCTAAVSRGRGPGTQDTVAEGRRGDAGGKSTDPRRQESADRARHAARRGSLHLRR